MDADTLVETAQGLVTMPTFVEEGSINVRSLFVQAFSVLVYLTNIFSKASAGVTDIESRRLAFASFTVGFSGSQVRAEKAVIRTTDSREIELQPHLKQMLDSMGVKSAGTAQTTVIQLALCVILLHGNKFSSEVIGSIPLVRTVRGGYAQQDYANCAGSWSTSVDKARNNGSRCTDTGWRKCSG